MHHRPFAADLTRPLGTAAGDIRRREGFLVAVGGPPDGGRAIGLGEATPLPGWTESTTACEAAIDEARRVGEADEGAAAAVASVDPTATPAARHGLALSVADAAARAADRSLAERLAREADGPAATAASVPVNATVGDGSPTETAAAAERAADAGFDCLKLKVGARGVDADAERIRAVRRAVGDGIALRVDANGAWDRQTARRALRELSPFGLAYVEQPLPADDLAGAAALRRERSGDGAPVALDESVAAHGLGAVLEANAADAVVLKPMALGGPDRALSAALRARAAGVEPVVTTTIDAVVARTAAVHVAAAIPDVAPCGLATGSLLADDLAPDPCPVADGRISVPSGPGLAGGAFEALWRSVTDQ